MIGCSTTRGQAGYVDLPGIAGNYLSVPDEAALDITGDITIVARVAANLTISHMTVAAKWDSYGFVLQETTAWFGFNDGVQRFIFSDAPPATPGVWKWIAVTFDANNGAGQHSVRFWNGDDGATWTQVGATQTGSTGPSTLVPTSATLNIGQLAGIYPLDGNISHVSIRNGIGASGTVGAASVLAPGFRLPRQYR